mmetsp:Transcript_25205/g.39106  ORF Transcript_25205/g.39106 Transcript_25205/m.39106 type:complete len:318 (+) Transcript_25205:747-1700(+)
MSAFLPLTFKPRFLHFSLSLATVRLPIESSSSASISSSLSLSDGFVGLSALGDLGSSTASSIFSSSSSCSLSATFSELTDVLAPCSSTASSSSFSELASAVSSGGSLTAISSSFSSLPTSSISSSPSISPSGSISRFAAVLSSGNSIAFSTGTAGGLGVLGDSKAGGISSDGATLALRSSDMAPSDEYISASSPASPPASFIGNDALCAISPASDPPCCKTVAVATSTEAKASSFPELREGSLSALEEARIFAPSSSDLSSSVPSPSTADGRYPSSIISFNLSSDGCALWGSFISLEFSSLEDKDLAGDLATSSGPT